MTVTVEKVAAKIKALPEREFEAFLSWLADDEMEQADEWDRELERDSQTGGRLDSVLARARTDIAGGRTKF